MRQALAILSLLLAACAKPAPALTTPPFGFELAPVDPIAEGVGDAGATKDAATEAGEGPLAAVTLPRLGAAGTLSFKDLRGRAVIVHFFAAWCAPCRVALPKLAQIFARRSGQIVVVAVSMDDDAKDGESFLRSLGLTIPAVHDPHHETARALTLRSMPSTFVLDPRGRLVKSYEGYAPGVEDAIEQAADDALGAP